MRKPIFEEFAWAHTPERPSQFLSQLIHLLPFSVYRNGLRSFFEDWVFGQRIMFCLQLNRSFGYAVVRESWAKASSLMSRSAVFGQASRHRQTLFLRSYSFLRNICKKKLPPYELNTVSRSKTIMESSPTWLIIWRRLCLSGFLFNSLIMKVAITSVKYWP